MVERKLVSFAAIVALWTLVTLLIKVIRIHLKWKYIQGKNYAILVAMLRKRSYFVKKTFVPAGLECSYGKIVIPLLRSRFWPAFSYEHIEIFTKEREARRDLGNRASPVDRAHMKRP